MDLTAGIRAEREKIHDRIAGLEAEIAKLSAAERELEAVEARLAKLDLNGTTTPVRAVEKSSAAGRRMRPEEVLELVRAHLEKVGRATGTAAMAKTLDISTDSAFTALRKLEDAGAISVKRDGKKPMIVRWVGEKQAKTRKRQALPSGETERRLRAYLKEHPRIDGGMVKLAEGADVPKGSVSGTLLKLEREGLVKIERHGPQKPVTIHYKESDSSSNGAGSAQNATV